MVVLGFTLKVLGFAARKASMIVAPVAVVLAWGAAEQAADKRRTVTTDTGTRT
ncbi:hypothetical protein [Actinomycetospora chiangmaiensis]|uniref:hypothetical protein n=1 Tax=Actinomycetospora chiangmaiensis TaxID=402650 RepID=UPI0003817723|nr:hypothetical protein [Actinomycetospora chiangmaiensis]